MGREPDIAELAPEAAVRAEGLALGFDAVGIAKPDQLDPAAGRLRAFLGAGRHGTMTWMQANAVRRESPVALWPEAKSVVVVAMNYGPATDPLADVMRAEYGTIAAYARGQDYHEVMKARLKRLGRWLAERFDTEVKVFVDTAPVMEKPLAEQAGLGWQGKHTNLVSRNFGSWLLLGEAFTTLDLKSDAVGRDACGGCTRCLDVCPTNAFPVPYELDARRCISYLTIEHKGHIPREFRAAIGNRIFGCDDCLAVCPWNKYAKLAAENSLRARTELTAPMLGDLAMLDDDSFRAVFAGSPVKRTGRDRFIRNVLIAIGNSGLSALGSAPRRLLGDPSPLVRAMAVWALARIDGGTFAAERKMLRDAETDDDVRTEWDAA